MVIRYDLIDALFQILVHLLQLCQQVHDNLYTLQLLPRLDLAVKRQAVVEIENWLWIFRHHERTNFSLDEVELQLILLHEFDIVDVPGQANQSRNKLKLKQKIHILLIALLN
jgi:hypothetical protein